MSIDFDALRPELEELCSRYGIVEMSVFGSTVRGEDQPGSDVDLLYVRGPDSKRGLEFLGLQDELEELLGRPVDLVPKNHLHWIIREQVLNESRVLYAA